MRPPAAFAAARSLPWSSSPPHRHAFPRCSYGTPALRPLPRLPPARTSRPPRLLPSLSRPDALALRRLAVGTLLVDLWEPVAGLQLLRLAGRGGPAALAGFAQSAALHDALLHAFGALAYAAHAQVAAASTAAGRQRAAQAALLVALVLAAGLVVAQWTGAPVLAAGVAPAEACFRARALGLPGVLAISALTGVARARGRVGLPPRAAALDAAAAVALASAVPPSIAGAATPALAAAAGSTIGAVGLQGGLRLSMLRVGDTRGLLHDAGGVLRLLAPAAAQRAVEGGSVALCAARAALAGPAASVAFGVALQTAFACAALWWPICVAASSRMASVVGLPGGRDRADRIAGVACRVTLALGSLVALAIWSMADPLSAVFVEDAACRRAGAQALRMFAPVVVLQAATDAILATLIAAGQGRFVCNVGVASAVVCAGVLWVFSPSVGTSTAALAAMLVVQTVAGGLRLFVFRGRRVIL